jgi:streptogramin lyase
MSRLPRRVFRALALLLLPAAAAFPQTETPTTVATGAYHATELSRNVNGVRVDARPDGSVWFLVPAQDRIAVLREGVITYWQIRDDDHIGANPVDFEIEGDLVWFIETGESEIDAGKSVFARLNTATGELREWVVPGSRPAGFYRAPDGRTVWLPQTNGRLQSLDLETLEVADHRSQATSAYSDIVVAADGALWMTDFGNNRIVRYEIGATTETYWLMLDPLLARLNPAAIRFDQAGKLWITQRSAARVDRFDPATGTIDSFFGFSSPTHLEIFAERLYVTQANGANGKVVVLDPRLGAFSRQTLTPQTLDVGINPNSSEAEIVDRQITATTFASAPQSFAAADVKVSSPGVGVLATEFPSTNAYGLDVTGGAVWVGSDGRLVNLVLQTVGGASDLTVPVATQFAGPPDSEVRVDLTLFNRGTAAVSGDALLLFSPGSFAPRATFTVAPGETVLLEDFFGDAGSTSSIVLGPVRLRVTSGSAGDLLATVRTARARPGGSDFGYAIPALSAAESLGEGQSRTLFTGTRSSEVSVLGLYTPAGARGTLTLVASDGTVRGTVPFELAMNVAQEFNPAASAFGLPPQPGDVVRVGVTSGVLQSYVSVFDPGSGDVALSPPVAVTTDAVIPNAGSAPGVNTEFVSTLLLSNPGETAAEVTIAPYPLGFPFSLPSASLTLAAGASTEITPFPGLFQPPSGQGALVVTSSVPIAVALRVASRKAAADYAGFAPALDAARAIPDGASATAFGAPQTASRRTNLLLFNRGAAGVVTVVGLSGAGAEVGRVTLPVGDHRAARLNFVFAALGKPDQPVGRLLVQPSAGMRLYAWTAELDGLTGDPDILALR